MLAGPKGGGGKSKKENDVPVRHLRKQAQAQAQAQAQVEVPWREEVPHKGSERNEMYARCKKRASCFLGKGTSYPICKKGTCKKSRKGIYAALLRGRQQHKRRVTAKALRLLHGKRKK